MAVTGGIFGLYVVAHMIGNLKFFAGADAFNSYAGWLRRIGEPALGPGWYLWGQRCVLLVCAGAHIAAAVALTRRNRAARPVRYRHRVRGSTTTRTMRWGGAIIGLFVVYHVLDLSVGALHPGFVAGDVYHNVVTDFRHWYVTAVYTVAVLATGLHLRHGLWAATRSLGGRVRVSKAGSTGAAAAIAAAIAVVIAAGFLAVPLSIQLGLVR
jgi:succinate dehydrogenase / fumarate reductase, cytochrome b subunit